MHVLVAGSTGVLGRRIVRLLVGPAHQVTALTRRSDQAGLLRSVGANPVVTDAFDLVSLAAAVKRASPDVIMNQLTDLTAGNSTAYAALRAHGTRNRMDAARAAIVGRIVCQEIAWAHAVDANPAGEGIPLDLGAPSPAGQPFRRPPRWNRPPRRPPNRLCCVRACSTGRTRGTSRGAARRLTPALDASSSTMTSPASSMSRPWLGHRDQ